MGRAARRRRERRERELAERRGALGGDEPGPSPFAGMPFVGLFDGMMRRGGGWTRALEYDPRTGQWVDVTDAVPEPDPRPDPAHSDSKPPPGPGRRRDAGHGRAQPLRPTRSRRCSAGRTPLPVIWVGDLNSDANAATITGQVPATSTYRDVIAAGFTDSWPANRPGSPGSTCCHAEDPLNERATLDERIDYVLTRGPLSARSAFLVGSNRLERVLYGRWPSDHAGVVAALQLETAS